MNRACWLLLGASLLAACGRQGAPVPAAPAGDVPAPAAQPTLPKAPPEADPDGPAEAAAETPVIAPTTAFSLESRGAAVGAPSTEAPILVAVRSAGHAGFDRIVFEFDAGGLPQWRTDWVAIPITDCGAGQVVPVSGTAWLQVRFSGAAAHTPEGKATSGPRQRRLRHPVVRDLARTCDFEGEVTWVAGPAGQHPYRVDTLTAPPRLVVDIAH